MIAKNACVVAEAVEHSGIQPHHIVLEVGFGPGKGLMKTLEKLKGLVLSFILLFMISMMNR